jgi:hypothetical protein
MHLPALRFQALCPLGKGAAALEAAQTLYRTHVNHRPNDPAALIKITAPPTGADTPLCFVANGPEASLLLALVRSWHDSETDPAKHRLVEAIKQVIERQSGQSLNESFPSDKAQTTPSFHYEITGSYGTLCR